MTTPLQRIEILLRQLYGPAVGGQVVPLLRERLQRFRQQHILPPARPLDHRDAILITYGDQFQQEGESPLRTLRRFLLAELGQAISGVHILPCFPYSSDDGFSVIDYYRVDPALGDWQDVADLGQHYRLMFDAVINHVSQQSAWFQGFLQDKAPYTDYFITVDPATDLSQVVRPRALPLLTAFDTASGKKYVWTTFSADQIDLNYANPQVLLEIIDVLLFFVAQGAELIRLDAIAYLWKEIGTSCIHLPQTHAVVKLWRAILDEVAPHVLIITETNVPHEENISYWGNYLPETGRTDEAQLVYNFSLAPLALHALQSGDATRLTAWAASLQAPPGATFFNFIASHDGIGVMPARGILDAAEIDALVRQTLAHGGQIGYKANPDGSRSAYELNITLYDFLNDPARPDRPRDVRRFLAAQAILLSLAGVPGIYVHSLFGSRNCQECYEQSGRARSLNRQKFRLRALEERLADGTRHERHVFAAMRRALAVRGEHPAFHPTAAQYVLALHPNVFAVLRRSTEPEPDTVLVLVNVSAHAQELDLAALPAALGPWPATWRDALSGRRFVGPEIELGAYETLWLGPGEI